MRFKTFALASVAFALALTGEPAFAQTRVQLRNEANTAQVGTEANPLVTKGGASEAQLGFVGGNVGAVTVAPTVSTSAYASGDAMGGLMTFANVARVAGGTGYIQAVTINFKTAQTTPIDFVWCGSSNLPNTTITDNAAVAVAAADFDKCRVIHVADCSSLGTPSVCSADNLAFPFVLASGTTGYAFLTPRGTPTLGSVSDVSVTLRVIRN